MDATELEAADNANAEGLWLDLVAAFDRDRPCAPSTRIADLLDSFVFVRLPSPAPRVTLVNRVARFVLRRF